ncbi:hypothetical protein [Methylobacter sp.]|uniref:hypothetical protein n=1 Tax=Methylobacter sp. TaxID=2051955 RepID=UPI002FDDAECA
MNGIKFKRGTTLVLHGQYLDDAGNPAPLTGVTLKSQVRDKDKLIADLTITVIDEDAGDYELSVPAGTAKWPVGTLVWDIKETVAGVHRYTQTLTMLIEDSVTE